MPSEIELKLLLPGSDAATATAALRLAPVLASCAPTEQWLYNRYYDTPDCTLRQQRAALRLRQVRLHPASAPATAPGAWWQTFKTAGVSRGGLSQRGEWECQVPGGELDVAALQATPWRDLDPDGCLFAHLQPCFETHCHRTTWQVQTSPDTSIEVALDAGEIVAGARRVPILELELELLSGDPSSLFQLASAIGQHLVTTPSDVSKAERGYTLLNGN